MRYSIFNNNSFPKNVQLRYLSDIKMPVATARNMKNKVNYYLSNIEQFPIMTYLNGNDEPLRRHIAIACLDLNPTDLNSEGVNNCIDNFKNTIMHEKEYLDIKHLNDYITINQNNIICDGAHRASMLYNNGIRIVPIAIELPKTITHATVTPTTTKTIITEATTTTTKQELLDLLKQASDSVDKAGRYHLYHALPFTDLPQYANIPLSNSIDPLVKYVDFNDKTVIDFGCYLGGITFTLQRDYGAKVIGIDHDKFSIDFAYTLEHYYQTGAKFIQGDIDSIITDLMTQDVKADIGVCLNVFHWIINKYGYYAAADTLHKISEVCDTLLFKVATGGPGLDGYIMNSNGLGKVEELITYIKLHSLYKNVVVLETDKNNGRSLLLLKKGDD